MSLLPFADGDYEVSLRIDEPQLFLVNTTDYGSDGFVFHTYNLSEPRQDVLVSVYPASVNQTLNVYVQFDEQPTFSNYEYYMKVCVILLRQNNLNEIRFVDEFV